MTEHILSGHPDDVEIAAVVAALAVVAGRREAAVSAGPIVASGIPGWRLALRRNSTTKSVPKGPAAWRRALR